MKPTVIWEDPPPPNGKEHRIVERSEMKAHPGRWMLWSDCASRSVGTKLREEGFEVVTRSIPKSNPPRFRAYARWPVTPKSSKTTVMTNNDLEHLQTAEAGADNG